MGAEITTTASQASTAIADFISFDSALAALERCLRVHCGHYFDLLLLLLLLWKRIRRRCLSWRCPRGRWPTAHRHLPSLAGQLWLMHCSSFRANDILFFALPLPTPPVGRTAASTQADPPPPPAPPSSITVASYSSSGMKILPLLPPTPSSTHFFHQPNSSSAACCLSSGLHGCCCCFTLRTPL